MISQAKDGPYSLPGRAPQRISKYGMTYRVERSLKQFGQSFYGEVLPTSGGPLEACVSLVEKRSLEFVLQKCD